MTFRRLFFAALCAAFVAGIVFSVVQYYRVEPLILEAETYEGEAPHEHVAEAAAHVDAPGTPAHDHQAKGESAETSENMNEPWGPTDGFERSAYTVLANLLAAAAFALIMGAISIFTNIPITDRNGVIWGLAGFLTVSLAPAFGLAPELPGMPAADLVARQVWWWGTVVATGAAALILAKFRQAWAVIAAIVLAAAPHLIGAPQLTEHETSALPAHLANHFAASALASSAIMWIVLGAGFGLINDYLAKRKSAS